METELLVFGDASVGKPRAGALLLTADVSAGSPDGRETPGRFECFGTPGMVFFAGDGR